MFVNCLVTRLDISKVTMSVKGVGQKFRLPYSFKGVSHPSNVVCPVKL